MGRRQVNGVVGDIFSEDLHAKRVASLADATLGVLQGATLGVHAIGNALALAEGLKAKHAIKQVDRMLSNRGIDPWKSFASWVPFMVADRPEIVAAMDWTDFDDDDQTTLAISLITKHGRATPLVWKTVKKSELKGARNEHEDSLLERLREVLPAGVKATILADRGFGDQGLYELLQDQLGFDFVVRFRGVVQVTDENGVTKQAKEWLRDDGRAVILRKARVTKVGRQVGAVVCVKQRGMKEAWYLATSKDSAPASQIIKLYGRRFTIEETFRDQKNLRFGMGLSETRIGTPERRDRLLLVSALAIALLTLLGAAGEAIGIDRYLKANTVKRRTLSLLRQGLFHYAAIPMMKPETFTPLMEKFDELIREHEVCRDAFGLI
jgi:hypothetical protein